MHQTPHKASRKALTPPPFSFLQCVAIDPEEDRLAIGDDSGAITLRYGLRAALAAAAGVGTLKTGGEALKGEAPRGDPAALGRMLSTTRHWHSGPVAALAFSPDGCYLLSGGREATLVRQKTNFW